MPADVDENCRDIAPGANMATAFARAAMIPNALPGWRGFLAPRAGVAIAASKPSPRPACGTSRRHAGMARLCGWSTELRAIFQAGARRRGDLRAHITSTSFPAYDFAPRDRGSGIVLLDTPPGRLRRSRLVRRSKRSHRSARGGVEIRESRSRCGPLTPRPSNPASARSTTTLTCAILA